MFDLNVTHSQHFVTFVTFYSAYELHFCCFVSLSSDLLFETGSVQVLNNEEKQMKEWFLIPCLILKCTDAFLLDVIY